MLCLLCAPEYIWEYLCAMRKLSMDELNRKTIEEFHQSKKNPIIIVLDNVRSMHNVGSIFRTADAFLIDSIYLCGYTPQPPHRDIHKTALGATETVTWKYFSNAIEASAQLRRSGYQVWAIEQTDASHHLQVTDFSKNQNLALVFGNEVEGVQPEVLKLCDGSIEIPQMGMKHSLNIAVAAGIVLWELVRRSLVDNKS